MKRISVIFITLAFVLSGCGDSPSGPSEELALSRARETASIVFHYSRNDFVEAERQQAFCDWVIAELGVVPARKISYNKYLTRAHMGQLTGASNTNGFAQPEEFSLHTIWPFDNHEPVHLYTSLFGDPVALLNECIAVSFQTNPAGNDTVPRWSGQPRSMSSPGAFGARGRSSQSIPSSRPGSSFSHRQTSVIRNPDPSFCSSGRAEDSIV